MFGVVDVALRIQIPITNFDRMIKTIKAHVVIILSAQGVAGTV
jgi:hypothetical protein